jgi:rSAM/selenodomain-associated transferase 2
MKISILIPTLNEAACLESALQRLAPMRSAGHEIIVADGNSRDGTLKIAKRLADRALTAPRGRARQMNAAAASATSGLLLFLHADTELPAGAAAAIATGLERSGALWGHFDVQLSGRRPLLRVVEWLINRRSRLSGIATGDQAIVVRREAFEHIGGFPNIPLMEDVALSRKLRRLTRPVCLNAKVITSSRRWEHAGIFATVLHMWRLRLAYSLGADPAKLALRYPHTREHPDSF